MKIVATTIGTRVYYGFETTAGVRPTSLSEYTLLEDCTSHPDFNPEREQIETTTLKEENNKTYTYGLRDFGTMEFGFNLTQDTLDLFLAQGTGILDLYKTNMEAGKRLWLVVDIRNVNKSYFIPVEPQDFGLPEGTVNTKYELTVRFTATGDGIWADDLTSGDEPTPTPPAPEFDYSITYDLTNATSSNTATGVNIGDGYQTEITVGTPNISMSTTITMGGEDITEQAVAEIIDDTVIVVDIPEVTADVVISCVVELEEQP